MYKILLYNCIPDLEKEVTKYLKKGWKLYGNVQCIPPNCDPDGCNAWIQVVLKTTD